MSDQEKPPGAIELSTGRIAPEKKTIATIVRELREAADQVRSVARDFLSIASVEPGVNLDEMTPEVIGNLAYAQSLLEGDALLFSDVLEGVDGDAGMRSAAADTHGQEVIDAAILKAVTETDAARHLCSRPDCERCQERRESLQ